MGLSLLMTGTLYVYTPVSKDAGKTFTVKATDGSFSGTYTFPTALYKMIKVPGQKEYKLTYGSYNETVLLPYGGIVKVNLGLEANTWAGIKRVVDAGQEASFLTAGDQRTVTLSTGKTVIFDVAGVDTYDNCVDFIAHDALLTTTQMNSTNTNSGGFAGAPLRSWLEDTFLSYLPDDLQAVIGTKTVVTSVGSQSTALQNTDCKIWLATEFEVRGGTTYAAATEAASNRQYPVFVDNASRVKHLGASGAPVVWWLSSPCVSNSANFCVTMTDGSASYNGATSSYGVVPGFRILKS